MSDLVKGSKFLKDGGWLSGYYAVPRLTPDEIFHNLVLCGAWSEIDYNPLDSLEASLELARLHGIFNHYCLKMKGDDWVICETEYGGNYDIKSFGETPQEAICLFILRWPEADLIDRELPYSGWATRQQDWKELYESD